MRLKVKNGINNCSIIDEVTALISIFKIALDFFRESETISKRHLFYQIFSRVAWRRCIREAFSEMQQPLILAIFVLILRRLIFM
jgi:hypothetical protein